MSSGHPAATGSEAADQADEQSADALRAAMVAEFASWSSASDAVLDAMRIVPRHLFVPEAPLSRAYSQEAVGTHRDAAGTVLSSASGPSLVAGMLTELDLRPGHRVLEIGAGTGYNAALIRHLVGARGAVTTVDILEAAATDARASLDAVGYDDVEVVCADGDLGFPANAPYDRVIVTVGAWDVAQAWTEQLTPDGVLVVPLRMNGVTRSIVLGRTERGWRSRELSECGFTPMRGDDKVGEPIVRLRGKTGLVELRTDDDRAIDEAALRGVLDRAPSIRWTGVTTRHGIVDNLDFRLAELDGFCRVIVRDRTGLVPPVHYWGSMGVTAGGTFVYLTTRPVDDPAGDTALQELGVCAYGPDPTGLAEQAAGRVLAWRADTEPLWIEVVPLDSPAVPAGRLRLRKRHNWVVVGPPDADTPGATGGDHRPETHRPPAGTHTEERNDR